MQLAKVRGTVVSTQKEPSLRGVKLLLLQLLDENGQLLPDYEVAADSGVGAGVDEWVLVTRGSAARQVFGSSQERPVDATVVAIVDTVTVENQTLYSKKDQYR
ncbi:carbon dioxide concentrating mechanism protein CcmL [Oxynema sp. CENA135]|jgi:carbon dioxide concentrating mechanism protein CcmL|uniref:Carboxysome shell vertex protein CcmL n=1 Tax=Oxynema aestuarii AP17 TaxID=2064643 RepID=A0A6H1TY71_9CYAN|nr:MULTISPECIES: EutN/CcmL family microcompartment protein [Oxynema]MBK4731747.1 carbon dioxide concentrating mechanism protein CcmL [Oxynema sp. CENA135]QIZ70713.1 carbon dioxide concentrating mechanism protein CcmL [Oxynema aestuarii AP17]RMH75381.1 MAG: carbon dioxide concentrating mechanism protein CcmL [Cyanobacteria bacterium J007]